MDSEQDSSADELTAEPELALQTAGQRLRSAREEQRLDIAHVAAETRIPQRHLETIEAGDYSELPSRTYAIGFARNYAKAVGLDENEIVNAVRDELSEGYSRQSALAGGMEPGDPAKLPSAGLAWFGAFAALILVVGLVAFYSTYFATGDELPSIVADADEAGDTSADLAATPADATGATPTANGRAIDLGGQVVFTALEDGIWVRFYEEGGERLLEKQMNTGESFELPADASEPRINTGRPDALAITIDGRRVPKLAEEPITMGDTPISAAALLARAETPDSARIETN
ncbi:RodZ domain-containing protein [Erythrobacter sp. GH1-10]|uniref:helix-turn-helix domain-containing protein n=1 Tax=Erythrobacter sp. GH1-10 TaxID=3349334 RepID=UPI0038781A81